MEIDQKVIDAIRFAVNLSMMLAGYDPWQIPAFSDPCDEWNIK